MTLFCLVCISCPAAVQPTCWQPHVSLHENRKSQLKDLPSYVKKCLTIADWAIRSVTVQSTHRQIMFSDPSSPLIEAVPSHPWAKNKCDFGLITGRNRDLSLQRLITDHRQCPLCQEAVDIICPIFEALLKYGIIFACEESPFQSTRFFCKKDSPSRTQQTSNLSKLLSSPPPSYHHYVAQAAGGPRWSFLFS